MAAKRAARKTGATRMTTPKKSAQKFPRKPRARFACVLASLPGGGPGGTVTLCIGPSIDPARAEELLAAGIGALSAPPDAPQLTAADVTPLSTPPAASAVTETARPGDGADDGLLDDDDNDGDGDDSDADDAMASRPSRRHSK